MPIMIKCDKVFTAAFVLGSLMLIATTSNGVSDKFEVKAADNCDATSTCQNTDLGGSNQNNNCVNSSRCVNEGTSSNQTTTVLIDLFE